MAKKIFQNTILNRKSKRVLKALRDPDKVFVLVLNNSKFKNLVIDLNTEDQLYDKGIDSLGNDIGDYSPITVEIKQFKGQRFDHITLKDTGDFYKSFNVIVSKGSVTITAKSIQDDGTDLARKYGNDILGLTDENMTKIINFAKSEYIKFLRKLWAG